jgi:hypothetical protein
MTALVATFPEPKRAPGMGYCPWRVGTESKDRFPQTFRSD